MVCLHAIEGANDHALGTFYDLRFTKVVDFLPCCLAPVQLAVSHALVGSGSGGVDEWTIVD